MVTHQLTAQTAHVHSIGGDKQVLNVHTHTHRHIHTHTHTHTKTGYNTLSSQCPHVHTHTHTHTSISTHDKVTQVTFTHSRCTNVISSLTSIIGLLSVHSGQWSTYCNGRTVPSLIQASVLVLLSTSEVNWYNEGCRGKGRGRGRPEKGGKVMLHTDRSLLTSHMITHTHR